MLPNGPGVGPCPEEELKKPTIEQIEEARKGVVAHQQPSEALVGRWQR